MGIKKLFTVVLTIIMLFVLCACDKDLGGSNPDPLPINGNETVSVDDKEAEIDISKHKDIVMWMVSSVPPEDLERVLGLINEKLNNDFNATLKYNLLSFDSEMMTKYRLLLSGGEQVDIIQGSAMFFSQYVSAGAYHALDEYLPVYAPDIWEKQLPEAWQQASHQGKIYAIPSMLKMYNPYGIMYRKDLLDKYGCEEITDFENLEAYFDVIAQNEKEMLPFNIAGDEVSYILRMMRAYCGFDIANTNQSIAYVDAGQEDITDVFNFAKTEKFNEFCKTMKRWKEKGFWSKSALSSKVWSRTNLENGLSAAGINLLGEYEGTQIFKCAPEGGELDFFDWPTYLGIFHYDDWMNDACAFPINGDDLGRTLMVYNALVTDEDYYMLAQYGIEGEHYIIQDGYRAYPEGITVDNTGYVYGGAGLWPLRNSEYYLQLSTFWQKAIDNAKYYDSIATENKLAAFNLDTSAIQAEIAAIEEVNIQYLYPLLYGMVEDVDSAIDTYIEKVENAGATTVLETVRTQIATYAKEIGY